MITIESLPVSYNVGDVFGGSCDVKDEIGVAGGVWRPFDELPKEKMDISLCILGKTYIATWLPEEMEFVIRKQTNKMTIRSMEEEAARLSGPDKEHALHGAHPTVSFECAADIRKYYQTGWNYIITSDKLVD